jgi:sterol 3beta-glucosyltransferase
MFGAWCLTNALKTNEDDRRAERVKWGVGNFLQGGGMRITICTFGTRGDVQPYLALAVGLQRAGHRVTLAASHDFATWIQSYGVDTYPMRFSAQEFIRTSPVQVVSKGRNVVGALQTTRYVLDTLLAAGLDDCWQATKGAEFVILGITACGGVDIASQRGLPMAFVALQPLFPPTRAFPNFLSPFRFSLGGRFNYLTYTLFMRAVWPIVGRSFNRWRTTRFGLPPWCSMRDMFNARRDFGTPWLFGYSPQVLPKPPDWEDCDHVTGYWFLDAPPDWQPSAALLHFLESGPPPVYVGFGSMSDKDPEHQTRLALCALELTGQRGVLLTGWGGIARLPTSARVFYVDDVPHSWLFPRMAAVVHHGGAGTTAAGLRAGVPSLITPFAAGDQYAWADRVVKLGVGPRMTDNKGLTAEKLAQAIHTAVTDSALRARTAAMGERIRAENGVARAVEVIERHAADFSRRTLSAQSLQR